MAGVADVTGDGKADLIVTGSDPNCAMTLRAGLSQLGITSTSGQELKFDFSSTPTSCLMPTLDKDIPGSVSLRPQVVELNGDGKADVALYVPRVDANARVFDAISRGGGSFETHVVDTGHVWGGTDSSTVVKCNSTPEPVLCERVVTGIEPHFLINADGDGLADLVVLTPQDQGGVLAWRMHSRGDGTFAPATSGTTPFPSLALETITKTPINGEGGGETLSRPWDILPADFSGDGVSDLAVVHGNIVAGNTQPLADSTEITIERAVSDRAGTYRAGTWMAGAVSMRDWRGYCTSTTDCPANREPVEMTGDVNGDGQTDILLAHEQGTSGASPPLTALDADITTAPRR